MDAFGHYFILAMLVVMAVGAMAIILFILLNRDSLKPMMTESCPIVPFLSIPGVFSFLGGMGLLVSDADKHCLWGLSLCFGGSLTIGGSILLNAATAKAKRAAWPILMACCIERKLEKKRFSEGTDGWLWRVACEIDYGGKHYVVKPKVRWSDTSQGEAPFWAEDQARQYILQVVSASGECKLRINPNNPLEAELLR